MLKILQAESSPQSFSLRVSILENCQYRCSYCLPGTVKPFAHKPSWLKPHEYREIGKALSHLPITKIRFTGGEPLLRRDLCEIIEIFRDAFPRATLAITTNGEHLATKFEALASAGISRVNVHIDSLNAAIYKRAMGNGDLAKILALLPTLKQAFEEVKINAVLQKGINDNELDDFIAFSIASGIEVRFIELMNTGSARAFVEEHFLDGAEAIRIIEKSYTIKPLMRRNPSDPSALFAIEGSNTTFGLIASDTQPFCADCNRLRLNAEGQLRGCLYQPSGLDLATLLRTQTKGEEMKNAIDMAVHGKRSFHPLIDRSHYSFSMAEIGG